MKKSAFTLIELIFVIVIIGLLAAIAAPRFLDTRNAAASSGIAEFAHQIEMKASEQCLLNQICDLNTIVLSDEKLRKYNDEFNKTTGTYKNYTVETNASEYNITNNGNTCLQIQYISADDDYNVTEVNTSCHQ